MNKLNFIKSNVWAIRPEVLSDLLCETYEITQMRVLAEAKRTKQPSTGNMAVINIGGIITQHGDIWEMLGMGCSCDTISAQLDSVMVDKSYSGVLLHIDSPGGSVYGVSELADKIYSMRGQKPILAVANSLMASAAYWIGSAADKITITPSGEIGSIGVLAVHQEGSQFEANIGVKTTIVKAGEHKAEGNPHEPLTSEAVRSIQGRVDDYYQMFIRGVARNRKTTQKDVIENYGQGRVLGAKDAVKVGMADNVGSIDDVVAKIMGSESGKKALMQAQLDLLKIR